MTEQDLLNWYSKFLRDLKRSGVDIGDMPKEVAESFLAIHQRVLLIYWKNKEVQRNHGNRSKTND